MFPEVHRSASNVQFGNYGVKDTAFHEPQANTPYSSGKSTFGSFNQRTAWGIKKGLNESPIALSGQTFGSTFNWGATSPAQSQPQQ
jgi:hypothetical protein